jgi:uncharacterized protein YraI
MFVRDQSFKTAVVAGGECQRQAARFAGSACAATAVNSADRAHFFRPVRPFLTGTLLPLPRSDSSKEFAMKMKIVLGAAMLLMPTATLAAPGIVTASASMKAGPGPAFPTVDRIPAGSRVDVHGCIRGDAWCDVSWSGDRGWVSSENLKYLYRNRYVYLPDYVDVVDVPIMPFVLSSYWASYYSGRPWYHRHAYWSNYWRSHARFATQVPADRSTRFGRSATRTEITEARMRPGVPPGVTRQQSFANVRGPQGAQERLPGVNGSGRTFSRMQHQPGAGAATRFSTVPVARPAMSPRIAQPNIGHANMGRVGGSPMNAHAQIGGPRPAPVMPSAGGGPRINAAPRIGGGPPGGGGPSHQRH